jgi:putative ABC transport system permease protein
MGRLRRWRGLIGIALSILRHERLRTTLAIIGVALALLASILLISVGLGVVETGQQQFDQAGRDLWISGGPTEIQPGSIGTFENSLINAHQLEIQLDARDDVAVAAPLVFQTVYASPNQTDFDTVIGVGAPAHEGAISVTEGRGTSRKDIHYGDGQYNGPMVQEVVVDRAVADKYNLAVGDTLYIGSTLSVARQYNFTVVGISSQYSNSVGAPTVVMQPSELQEISGLTASDRASLMTVRLKDSANLTQTKAALEAAYPEYTIRTNEEQFQSIIADKAIVIASGASLMFLAVIAGILLLTNLQLSLVARYRQTFGALTSLGTSYSSLNVVILVNTLMIGLLGSLLGSVLTPPSIWALNRLTLLLTGFENVVTLSGRLLLIAIATTLAISLLSGVVATFYLNRANPIDNLR